MSDSSLGRPRGKTEDTAQLQREVRAMADNGMRAEEIARRRDKSVSYIRSLLKPEPSDQFGASQAETTAAPAKAPKPYSARTLLWRAWLVAHMHPPASMLPAEPKLFWLRAVQAVATTEDGVCLRYGESGYFDRADFCAMHGVTEAELDLLVKRRLLAELDDGEGGIALPKGLGLVPRERSFRPPLPFGFEASPKGVQPRAAGPGRPVAGQSEMLHAFPGGRANGAEAGAGEGKSGPDLYSQDDCETPLKSDFYSQNYDCETPTEGGENACDIPPGDVARTAAAAAKSQESNGLSSSSSTLFPRAREKADCENDCESPEKRTEINLKRIADVDLAVKALGEDLARLAKLPTPLNSEELAAVAGWQQAGLTREAMISVVTKVVQRPKRPAKLNTLVYFTGAMADEIARLRKIGASPPQQPAAEPAAPVSAEDRAILDVIRVPAAAWNADHTCPFPPTLPSFKAAVARGAGPLAHQWLNVFGLWDEAGRPEIGKPPDFTKLASERAMFERDLSSAEDELTDPGAQQAAD
jgi:hypothetical protein